MQCNFDSFIQNLLPHRKSKAGHTVLDCVWSEVTGVFYVLDVMSYRSHPILDSEVSHSFSLKLFEPFLLLQKELLQRV